MKPAIVYTRFSPRPIKKLGGDTRECESCETQLTYCRQWCAQRGYQIAAEHRDEALSGATMERPGLAAAIADASRLGGVLVVYSLSRLARSTKDAIEIAEALQKGGADLASLHEQVDTTTPAGRLFYAIMSAMNTFEREVISERTSEAMNRHILSGRNMSSKAPYGYEIRGSKLVPNEYEQLVIERIMELHAAGECISAIAATLKREGITRRSTHDVHETQELRHPKRWGYRQIYNVIRREEARLVKA